MTAAVVSTIVMSLYVSGEGIWGGVCVGGEDARQPPHFDFEPVDLGYDGMGRMASRTAANTGRSWAADIPALLAWA